MRAMVSSVETSISLPGKIKIMSVDLLNKSLKRKVCNYLLNNQSAKIITGTLLNWSFLQFLEFF